MITVTLKNEMSSKIKLKMNEDVQGKRSLAELVLNLDNVQNIIKMTMCLNNNRLQLFGGWAGVLG